MSTKQNLWGAWSLLIIWIFANSIGWAAGLAVGAMLTLVAVKLPWLNEDRFFTYATLISLGLTIGLSQWVVMRRYLTRPIRWVTVILIGYLLCLITIVGGNSAKLGRPEIWDDILLLGLLGTTIGIPQWWILRQHFRQAGLWIFGTAIGFQCLLWIIINPSHSLTEFVVQGTIFGALAMTIPGVVLVWLVRQPFSTV